MAGQIDFKQFYEQSKITSDSISLLRAKSTMFHRQDKSFKVATSNMAFGMLAHLNIINEGDTPFIFSRLPILGISVLTQTNQYFPRNSYEPSYFCPNVENRPYFEILLYIYQSHF